jgi:hypothetical protein
MNLPDAPIAHQDFLAAHFFTVSDQDKSKDFCVRILGGRVMKPDNPCYKAKEASPRKLDTKVSSIPLSNCFTPLTSGLIAIVRDAR